MRRTVHVAGWGLLALAVVTAAIIVTVGPFRTHGDTALGRWGVWAAVVIVPITVLLGLPALLDKIKGSASEPELDLRNAEDELAAVVLKQVQDARSRLIGAVEPGDRAANVRFVKDSGRFREVGGAIEGNLNTVLEYYQSLEPARLVVLGEAGAGKTVLAMDLLILLLERRQANKSLPVPVLVSAAAYDTRMAWEQWLAGHLALRFTIGTKAAARLIRDGRILPLVDGVDEMDPAGGPERAQALVRGLNEWMHGREKSPVIVTCRHGEYQALARDVDRATHIKMLPLTGNEAAGHLHEQFRNQDELERWGPVLAALHTDPAGAVAGQLGTPWRLTLALAAFHDGGDPSRLLPCGAELAGEDTETGYGRRINQLLLGGYVPAAVRLRDPAGRYDPLNVQRWLAALADGLAWQAHHARSASDIRLDQWWEPTGRRATRLTHIAVAAVPALAWLMAGSITFNPWFVVTGSFAAAAAAAAEGRPSPERLRLGEVTTSRGMRRFAPGLAFGLGVGTAAGQGAGLGVGLVVGLGIALGIGLSFGLLADNSPQAIGPRDVIRADGRYRLAVGLMLGLSFGLTFGLRFGLRFGSAAGLGFGLAAGVTFGHTYGHASLPRGGSSAWTRHYVSVVINAARRRGPLRFGAFLDWAQEAGLLRVSGVAYQFRHRQLQDWLTSPHAD